MNLKKKFITAVSAFAIVMSMAAPAGVAEVIDLAPVPGTGVVVVADAGTFSVSICNVTGDVNFGTVGVSTIDSNTGNATLSICYDDTRLERPGFKTYLSAGVWTTQATLPDYFPAASKIIPAENLRVVGCWSPLSTQLTGSGVIYGIGANPILLGQPQGYRAWTSEFGPNTLNAPTMVGYGDEGRGTTATIAPVALQLTVPANTSAAQYGTTITLDVNPRVD